MDEQPLDAIAYNWLALTLTCLALSFFGGAVIFEFARRGEWAVVACGVVYVGTMAVVGWKSARAFLKG